MSPHIPTGGFPGIDLAFQQNRTVLRSWRGGRKLQRHLPVGQFPVVKKVKTHFYLFLRLHSCNFHFQIFIPQFCPQRIGLLGGGIELNQCLCRPFQVDSGGIRLSFQAVT